MNSLKQTPLNSCHRLLGARMVDFEGWEMPLYYSGIVEEHRCVRKEAGLFDISHMGEIRVEGRLAETYLQQLLTNNVHQLSVGRGQYSLMCREDGGVVDDLYVYRLSDETYLMVVNASRVSVDLAWCLDQSKNLLENLSERNRTKNDLTISNVSQAYGALAVQGPRCTEFIGAVFPGASVAGAEVAQVTDLRKNEIGNWRFGEASVWVARTGYTGEDGFEILGCGEDIPKVWQALLEEGRPAGLKPCGLGARDTLRTEVCYPLYGHELSETISPLEAGLGYFVAMEKETFSGRDALVAQKQAGPVRRLVAFQMTGKSAPPRPGYPVSLPDGTKIGSVTSGTQSPSLECGIGLALIERKYADSTRDVFIEIRGRQTPACLVKKPIYRKPTTVH